MFPDIVRTRTQLEPPDRLPLPRGPVARVLQLVRSEDKHSQATRPYSFIEFDTYIQKAKRTYADSRGNRNLNTLNTELQDVQRIMVQNIDDVLQRGAVLSGELT